MKLKTASLLQLKDIHIKRFKVDENITGVNRLILDADFTPFETAGEGKKLKGIDFTLKVNAGTKNPALRAEISMLAVFYVGEDLDEKKQLKVLLYNGLSILYGIVRGMIFQSCSILPPQYRLLPAVNIVELIKDKMSAERKNRLQSKPEKR